MIKAISRLAPIALALTAHAGQAGVVNQKAKLASERVASLLQSQDGQRFAPSSEAITGLTQKVAAKIENGALVTYFALNGWSGTFEDQGADGTVERFAWDRSDMKGAAAATEPIQRIYADCVLPLTIQRLCQEPGNDRRSECFNVQTVFPIDYRQCLNAIQGYNGPHTKGYRY